MSTVYAKIAKRLPAPIFKLGAQAFIKKDFPRHLFIELNSSCNLSCSFCPRERTSEDMDLGLFRKIIDEATQYGPRSFSLHLFGEPFLYPRLFDATRYIKEKCSRHTILLTTNGTFLNDRVDDLISSKVDQVFWTWRREARFTRATVLKLKKWGKFRVRFINEITPKEGYEEWRDWKNTEGRRMHNYGGWVNLARWKVRPNQPKRWPCYHLWMAPAVAWNGQFLMCCADPHRKEVFGDINKESVNECWQRIEKVRRSQLEGKYEGICAGCDVWREVPDLFFDWQKTKSS